MSELARLDARGPRPSDWPVETHFGEERLWAREVDDLNEEIERYWREALRVRIAWGMAAGGWTAAILMAIGWWHMHLHG